MSPIWKIGHPEDVRTTTRIGSGTSEFPTRHDCESPLTHMKSIPRPYTEAEDTASSHRKSWKSNSTICGIGIFSQSGNMVIWPLWPVIDIDALVAASGYLLWTRQSVLGLGAQILWQEGSNKYEYHIKTCDFPRPFSGSV